MISVYQYIIIIGNSNGLSRMSKNTSIALGEHWQAFIEKQVSSGRYGSASEVIRNALRPAAIKTDSSGLLRMYSSS